MTTIKRWCGYVHVLLGLAVAVQLVASPTYDVDASNITVGRHLLRPAKGSSG